MKKLILHIPHSSIEIPDKDGFIVNDEILNQELIKITDWHTEDLYGNEKDIEVVAPFSRIFCDAERFADDSKEVMFQFGMGVLYSTLDSGEIMRNITPELRNKVLKNYYWKHHKNLSNKVTEQLKLNDECLIIDCHSFPKKPLNKALDRNPNRPDFNIGTDSYHTPKWIVEKGTEYFENLGYSVRIDWPYSGALVPLEFYQKDKRVSSVLLEINRRLYLKEGTNEKTDSYLKTKEVVQGFLDRMRG